MILLLKKNALLITIFTLFSGCLSFGNDWETTHPKKTQINFALKFCNLKHTNSAKLYGIKFIGSGIDNAIFIKVSVKKSELNRFLNNNIVSKKLIKRIEKNNNPLYPAWYDIHNKQLESAQYNTNNYTTVNLSIFTEKTNKITCYIFAHQN